MCLGIIFFMFLMLGVCWASWIYGFVVFIWKIFDCYFFKYFSGPMLLWGLPITYILGYWGCPVAHRCSILFFPCNLFFLFVSFWIMFIALSWSSLIFSSAVFNVLLIPSSIFFISDIVVFIPRSLIRICVCLVSSVSLLNMLNLFSSFVNRECIYSNYPNVLVS